MSSSSTWAPGDRWDELRSRLDAELDALPEKYRAPLVLCYLEGKTHVEAAQLLGWPSGSISARVNRGRELLRRRLAGRDWELHASIFPFLLGCFTDSSPLPSRLVEDTIAVALAAFPGEQLMGSGGTNSLVAELAESALKAPSRPRFGRRLRALLICLVAFLIFGAAAYAMAGINVFGPFNATGAGGNVNASPPAHACH
jgi:hypothetical protein